MRSGETPSWMSQSVRCWVIAAERYSASTRLPHSRRTAALAVVFRAMEGDDTPSARGADPVAPRV